MGQCDCSYRAHIWYTPVHPIKLVQPEKLLYTQGCAIHPVDKQRIRPIVVSRKDSSNQTKSLLLTNTGDSLKMISLRKIPHNDVLN